MRREGGEQVNQQGCLSVPVSDIPSVSLESISESNSKIF